MAAAAVNPNDMDDVLQRVGFNANARAILTDPDREDVTLVSLSDMVDDDVDAMIVTLRKIIQDVGPPPRHIYVKATAIENLKTVAYVCRHFRRTGRTVTHQIFDRNFINDWKQQRKIEEDYDDLDQSEYPKLAKSDNATIFEFIEDFPEQLACITGIGGRPLAYVLREDEAVPAEADDPLYGVADSQYTSVRKEVIAHAELAGHHFRQDNERVFEILKNSIAEFEEVKVWIKGFIRAKNGRGAWTAFKNHYLGTAQMDGIANRADDRIESLNYSGEKQRYNFETHVSNFKKAHLDLAKAGQEPDGRTKVRKFLQSITASNMQTAVSVVRSREDYLTDFEATVNYLRQFVATASSTRNISTTTARTSGSGNDKPPPKPDGLQYRWYKKEEFKALPEEAQAWLRYEKNHRSKEGLEDKKKEKRRLKTLLRKEKCKLAKLKAKVEKKKDDDKDDESEEE